MKTQKLKFEGASGDMLSVHIFEHARHPKSFTSLNKADHLFSREKDSMYAGTMIVNWAFRYI